MTRTSMPQAAPIFVGLLSIVLAACGDAPAPPLESPSDANAALGAAPPAAITTVNGLTVIAIPAKLVSLGDGLVKIHALGSAHGKNIGVEVEITERAITLRSAGAPSDALLETLGRAYEVVPPNPQMRAEMEYRIDFADGELKDIDRRKVKMKATIDTGLKSEYAEVYISFDASRNALEIAEADPSFRTNVVRAFSTQ